MAIGERNGGCDAASVAEGERRGRGIGTRRRAIRLLEDIGREAHTRVRV